MIPLTLIISIISSSTVVVGFIFINIIHWKLIRTYALKIAQLEFKLERLDKKLHILESRMPGTTWVDMATHKTYVRSPNEENK